jgi:hypothetical protein
MFWKYNFQAFIIVIKIKCNNIKTFSNFMFIDSTIYSVNIIQWWKGSNINIWNFNCDIDVIIYFIR